MKLFKLIASKAGRIVFDDRVQADSPRTAREQMKSVLGLQSLTGVVYSITEIPVELIKELVNARVAEVILSRNGRSGNVNLEALIGSAVTDAIGARLRPIEQRLGGLESAGQSGTTRRRFDSPPAQGTADQWTDGRGCELGDGAPVLQPEQKPEADGGALRSVDQHGQSPHPEGELVMSVAIRKYGARFFAVYVNGELLAVTVYRKGAVAVAARLREIDYPTLRVAEKGGSYASGR